MTEQFILGYVPLRIKQLGYSRYHLRYRDMILEANSTIRIQAYNELFFLIDNPENIIIESDYGIYDSTVSSDNTSMEIVHQHRGEIVIMERSGSRRSVKFIQVIIVN